MSQVLNLLSSLSKKIYQHNLIGEMFLVSTIYPIPEINTFQLIAEAAGLLDQQAL